MAGSLKNATTLLILLLAGMVATSGCTSSTDYRYSGDPGGSSVASPTSGESETLEILEHELEYEGSGWLFYATVVGTAKNVGTKRISHTTVRAKFYDPDGNLIGTGSDRITDLDPGETWKFSIRCTTTNEEVESYKIGVG